MKNFTSGIIHDNTVLRLSFDKIQTSTGSRYFVTAITDNAETISFDMKMDIKGDWNVVAPAPQWIKHLELQLNQLLTEQSKYQVVFN